MRPWALEAGVFGDRSLLYSRRERVAAVSSPTRDTGCFNRITICKRLRGKRLVQEPYRSIENAVMDVAWRNRH